MHVCAPVDKWRVARAEVTTKEPVAEAKAHS